MTDKILTTFEHFSIGKEVWVFDAKRRNIYPGAIEWIELKNPYKKWELIYIVRLSDGPNNKSAFSYSENNVFENKNEAEKLLKNSTNLSDQEKLWTI